MNINNHIEKVLISEAELTRRIKEIANKISEDYADKNPVMICLLKGSVSYFAHLCEQMYIPLEYEFLRASSYHGASTTGEVKLLHVPTISLKNRHVIIVEDIIDTGLTLSAIKKVMIDMNPASLAITTLLDKPVRRLVNDIVPEYVGFVVPDEFVVGFGLDYNEEYRNLPYIGVLKKEIYEMCGQEFNVNSTQQLGKVLFEDLKLPVYKKTKSGYSTDVDVLEKLKKEHPVIEKILVYRTLMKLNSTYVEGLLPYVNTKTKRIHSYFHQTITATGRISSTEPNLQNIPTRIELGKQLRKAFKPEKGYIYIDADYSQIELRVLAHISQDENMINAFENDEDIHRQVASKVFDVPMEEVTKEQRSAAKAVNFGIVYGISDFGLAEQLGIGRKKAKQYIEQYKEKYMGIKNFMDNIVEEAKKRGYVETLFHRRREIPELSSNNYMVRQFGARVAMNTPIQGTAADIMKIAMIKLFDRIEKEKLSAKLILQVHDELIVECKKEESEQVKQVLKESMENATKLSIPLKVEISEANNWYEAK